MKKISYNLARRKLLMLWLIMAAVIFLIFFIQSILGKYTTHVPEVWEWLFHLLTPPLSLMIGILIAQLMSSAADFETDLFYFRLSQGISWFFLVVLLLSAILVPVIHLQQNMSLDKEHEKSIMEAFNTYNNFLLPLQGLSTLALGLFFTKK
ncbi:MAG: hypothetical protein NT040_01135 [Bacteroidetes bacterium]|nr:hypothetical protein [Bacteroidota bacterium]